MAYTSNMSTSTALADRAVALYDQEFVISGENTFTFGLPSLSVVKNSAGLHSATEFLVYTKLTVQTSALTEDTDATSEAMTDTKKTVTPAEYGNVVTRTELVQTKSGGIVDIAAVRLAANNMRESVEKLMILAGEAGSNELTVNASGEASTTAANILTAAFVQKAYNKLKRVGIPEPYFCVAHSDVLYDLRTETTSGGWLDANKYVSNMTILDNEVGKFGGFRFIESPLVTVNSDAGSGAVDTYHTQFFGANAFGYAVARPPGLRMTSSDKLARFMNIGWYGVFSFGLVDTNAHWLVTSGSTVGANT